MTDIKRVGVLGSGLMGGGIAQVAATAGYDTVVRDVSQQVWDKARAGIEKSLGKFVEKGKLPAPDRDAALRRLRFKAASRSGAGSLPFSTNLPSDFSIPARALSQTCCDTSRTTVS